MKPLQDLLKHSSIYAVGQILTRLASVLLLPLYTHCLTPADYGITAILDLTAAILALMIGGGMVTAVTRFHFDDDSADHQDRVWWTGLTSISGASFLVLLPLWGMRGLLSDLTLGSEQISGPWFYTLTLATTWSFVIGNLCDTYLRVRRWSGLFVLISLVRLALNVGLNVWMLVGLQMGVEGLLIGNLAATVLHTSALLFLFVRTRGGFRFDFGLARQLLSFSAPLVCMALLCMLMHEADRYVLRAVVSLEEVGVYSLAHKIGFAVNTLCLMPFISIWHVAIYDIHRMKDSRRIFCRVFDHFTSGLGILLLGASLIVHPLLPLLTPESYGDAVDLVSVILLGFFFFGLQIHFEIPAMLTKRTGLLIPGSALGVVVNIVGNVVLVPMIGAWGAAWAGVLTYAVCSFTILAFCRRALPLSYPWLKSSLVLMGLVATYLLCRFAIFPELSRIGQVAVSFGVCGVWAAALLARDALAWWAVRQIPSPDASPPADDRTDGAAAVVDHEVDSQLLCETGSRSE